MHPPQMGRHTLLFRPVAPVAQTLGLLVELLESPPMLLAPSHFEESTFACVHQQPQS